MNYNAETKTILCHICQTWKDIYTDIYLEDDNVLCLTCGAHLGFRWDIPDWQNDNEKVILKLKDIDKVIHDIRYSLGSIIKICKEINDFSVEVEKINSNLCEAQDILNKAIETLNNV